jgi:hypothetical protein
MAVITDVPVVFDEPHEEHEHAGPNGDHEVAHLDGPQGHREELPDHLVLLLLHGGRDGGHHAHPARLSRTTRIVSQHAYNELFTMHGSLMLYLFAGPFAFGGLANYIVPLQVGAPDMAFPRLNALSYWLYLGGG